MYLVYPATIKLISVVDEIVILFDYRSLTSKYLGKKVDSIYSLRITGYVVKSRQIAYFALIASKFKESLAYLIIARRYLLLYEGKFSLLLRKGHFILHTSYLILHIQ